MKNEINGGNNNEIYSERNIKRNKNEIIVNQNKQAAAENKAWRKGVKSEIEMGMAKQSAARRKRQKAAGSASGAAWRKNSDERNQRKRKISSIKWLEA